MAESKKSGSSGSSSSESVDAASNNDKSQSENFSHVAEEKKEPA